MENQVKKSVGNPNFKKKNQSNDSSQKKRYHFQLTQTYSNAKPVDKETGEMLENPYPPIYIVPNEGVALDNGNMRRWRYLYGYKSIWLDEQTMPEPTKSQLESEYNDLIFRKGSLFVNSTDQAKLKALMIQDGFEGNDNPVNETPKIFRLIDEGSELDRLTDSIDEAYEAETQVREASLEELLPLAQLYGINIDNPDRDNVRIKTQLVLRAKADPKGFLRNFVNPKNKVKYIITKAIQEDIISTTKIEGKVVMIDSGRILFDIKVNSDSVEEISKKVMAGDEAAEKLYRHLQTIFA